MKQEREGKVSLNDVLSEFAVSADQPTADLLDEFVRRYPDYADELTEFSARFAVQAIRENARSDAQELTPSDEASVLRAMSSFQNRLYELQQKDGGAAPSKDAVTNRPDPFEQMKVEGLDRLANGLHANRTFAMKVRDCMIKEETISPGFSRMVAEIVDVPIELVVAHHAKPMRISRSERHKATDKPSTSGQKQDFIAAVRGSGLNEEQQAWLLAL